MRLKRSILAVVVIAAALWAGTGAATAGPEGCVVAAGTLCQYTATRAGGIVAAGNGWRVRIFRGDCRETSGIIPTKSSQGKPCRVVTIGPHYMTDFDRAIVRKNNVVRRGDRVFVTSTRPADACLCVGGTFGSVAVGPDYNVKMP